jgi:GrpB-like predicted nucleotidyltransferase (UPF0157 family)
MTHWPSWATERVELQPANDAWQRRGEEMCRRLDSALAPWLVAPVEHVGSTAVHGLPAKPILDLQAAVADLSNASTFSAVLGSDGWHHVPPELDARAWRRFFVRVVDGRRDAHLHVMSPTSTRWAEQIAFRDALRADAQLARSYAELKATLARQHGDDREAYSAAKTGFIRAVVNAQV